MNNQSVRIKVAILGVGLSLLLGLGSRAVGVQVKPERSFQVTYQVWLKGLPVDAKELRLWIPLAASTPYQKISKRNIQTSLGYKITRDPEYGNDILFIHLRNPMPPELKLAVEYEATVHGKQLLLRETKPVRTTTVGKKMELYLKSNRLMVVDDRMRQMAALITAKARTPMQEAQAIYRYVVERMTYEKETPGWGRGDTLRACDVGTGNCTDFHSLFISLARARGIPARFQIGLPVPQGAQGTIPGYHCSAEFYIDGVGWIPVDASEAWKNRQRFDYFFGTYDPNRLAFSTGRDIRLVPEPANGPVNFFFKPYVEVDGRSFDGFETQFQYRSLQSV